jgi:Methyltransferase domain
VRARCRKRVVALVPNHVRGTILSQGRSRRGSARGIARGDRRLTASRCFPLSQLRSIVKQFVPQPILRTLKNRRTSLKWARIRQQYSHLSVAEAFTQTYRTKLWGSVGGDEFFSGDGSLDKFAAPYVEWLTRFIAERNINTVVDLGCGDFRIGQRICSANSVNYVGVDIVSELISYNESQFGSERVSFKCANIIEDDLPSGDICLIRQVFQHLSNKQIAGVLTNCSKFAYLVVTEDVYSGRGMRPNLDVMHGPDNRLHKRSGVFLEHAPFSLQIQNVLAMPCPETASVIRTCVIEGKLKPAARR